MAQTGEEARRKAMIGEPKAGKKAKKWYTHRDLNPKPSGP